VYVTQAFLIIACLAILPTLGLLFLRLQKFDKNFDELDSDEKVSLFELCV
jgi:hypothetical protein